jgi:RNA polymerase sigma factor (sigma-70 family)
LNSNDPDINLWKSFQQGDSDAFAAIFRKYYSSLFRFGTKLTGNTYLVEESIQELFLQLWKNKNESEIRSVKAYLLRALRYQIFHQLKKKNLQAAEINFDHPFELSYESLLIAEQERNERRELLMKAFSNLSSRQKEIVYLKFFQELSYDEVAQVMDINYQAARNLLYHAVKLLKNYLTAVSLVLLLPFFFCDGYR